MITHIFYHQEQVEELCALNSWSSIKEFVREDDEVIILDLGATLKKFLPIANRPKYLRYEVIRTDKPEERSYTYGLNLIMPQARFEWICLWRSDYIYHQNYFKSVLKGMEEGNVVIPYEALIGAEYCRDNWCRKNFKRLVRASFEELLIDSHICPVYQLLDIPHFAIKKDLWLRIGGMNNNLWGYGWQFPELFYRLIKQPDYQESVQYEMLAFHQYHVGSFSIGTNTETKVIEAKEGEEKLISALGSIEAANKFKEDVKRPPLKPRYDPVYYQPKRKMQLYQLFTNILKRIVYGLKVNKLISISRHFLIK